MQMQSKKVAQLWIDLAILIIFPNWEFFQPRLIDDTLTILVGIAPFAVDWYSHCQQQPCFVHGSFVQQFFSAEMCTTLALPKTNLFPVQTVDSSEILHHLGCIKPCK